jgi:hypothetical protein
MPPKKRKDMSTDTLDLDEGTEPVDQAVEGEVDEEIKRLEDEQRYLEKLEKRDQLRRSVEKLKCKIYVGDRVHTAPLASENESGSCGLRRKAEKALSRLGLHTPQTATSSESETPDNSDSSNVENDTSTSSSTLPENRRHKSRNKHPRGKHCPVAIEHLRYQYASRKYKYRQLDFPLFMACELESIKNRIKKEPRDKSLTYRVEHLIKTCYYSKQYEWQAMLDYHTSVMDEITSKRAHWRDNFVHIEAITLHPHIKDSPRRDPLPAPNETVQLDRHRSLYCSEFQEGKCRRSGPHSGTYGGKPVTVHHFCRTCWLRDRRQRYHSPTTDDCPHKPHEATSRGNNISQA